VRKITAHAIQNYLSSLYGHSVTLRSLSAKGVQEEGDDLKGFGYGSPLFLEYEISGEIKKAVLETMAPSPYGHDHFSDRAQAILWEHSSFNELPRHVRSLDSGTVLSSGQLISTGHAEEFFLLTEFIHGTGYFKDLERIRDSGFADDRDIQRAIALSDYLVSIHRKRSVDAALYTRRIRELIGHGECIMGLVDNYPAQFEFIDQELLRSIERSCVDWRWSIKPRTHRLTQVHGDFHPWNILFREGNDFTALDRSRGAWGEPADDTATMSINYLFFSLQRSERFEGDLEQLFSVFWDHYLTRSGDTEMLEVIAPFFAWRGLVLASPVWYPHLSLNVRKTIFRFIKNVLAVERFDPADMQRYLT